MYSLIITEKPKTALRIASALAEDKVSKIGFGGVYYFKFKREGKTFLTVPAVGHLFSLTEKNGDGRWKYPIFNVEWRPVFEINKKSRFSKKYFYNIKKLAKEAKEFIVGTDFDVEGEVIAYNILRFLCKPENMSLEEFLKNVKRMKFSTLTKHDLIKSYENILPHIEYGLAEAGLARHFLDFYFGINLSRALTLSLESAKGYKTLSTGRVQGPTLAILEKREREIEEFVPTPFWQIQLNGIVNQKTIKALHIKDKFWDENETKEVLEKCEGKNGFIEDLERKKYKQFPYPPFDLTSLQREAYNHFGYSPRKTLDIAQSLYEQALISYPRTSSQKLPPTIGYKFILENLSKQEEYSELCKKLLGKKLKPFEGKKTDPAHPAIYPTGNLPKKLSKEERKIYDLIVKRFLCVFAEPAIRESLNVKINVNNEIFVTSGTVTIEANWIEFYQPYVKFKDNPLPEMKIGDIVTVKKIQILSKETQPPNRFTQASILKEMEDLGLGTKATRAQILQTLYDRDYIEGRSIKVTILGKAIVRALEEYCPEILSVDLTRKFEEEMEAIEKNEIKKEKVIEEAKKHLTKILQKFKENEEKIGKKLLESLKETIKEEHELGICSKCGAELKIIKSHKTNKQFVGCSNYPKCKNIYPLPQNALIKHTKRVCPECKTPIIEVIRKGRKPFFMCLDPNCKTKEKWNLKNSKS